MTECFDPGLESVSVAETALSNIDGSTGQLEIRGFPIDELAGNASYEETVYLLLNGSLPTSEQLNKLRREMAERREIEDHVEGLLKQAAEEGKPAMDALRMGVAAANLGTDNGEQQEEIHRIISVFPTIVATYWRYRLGEERVLPRQDLNHAANYLYMLTGSVPTDEHVEALETYLNTVADHGLNASTFSARVIVSTESDLFSAATAAVGALKGPLHGGAPGPVLEMLRDVYANGDPEGYVSETLAAGDRLMGFGHRVYRVRDPRAAVLEAASKQLFEASDERDFFETARDFEEVATERLAEHVPDRKLETNVEFYTALLLDGIGIPKQLFTATFGISRVAGWMAHSLEQLENNRLIRPNGRYTGHSQRSWIPIDQR